MVHCCVMSLHDLPLDLALTRHIPDDGSGVLKQGRAEEYR